MRLLCHLAFPLFLRCSPLFSRRKQCGQKGKNSNNNGAGKTKATIALVYHCSRYTRAPTAYTQFPYTSSPFRAPFFGPFLVRFVLFCFILFVLPIAATCLLKTLMIPSRLMAFLQMRRFLQEGPHPSASQSNLYLSPTKLDVQLKSQLPIELLNFRPLLSPPPTHTHTPRGRT